MKKILSLLTLLSVISVGVYAQGISGGLKLGLNLANQTMSSTESVLLQALASDQAFTLVVT